MQYSSPRGAAQIILERLHYGKLALDGDLRIPSSQGYGVTLRSRGLDAAHDRSLAPTSLLGVRRIDQELFNAPLDSGGFLLRVAPFWPAGEPPVVLMRSRFRCEEGEGAYGRLYHQSAMWTTELSAFRADPSALLLLAQVELDARPDLLSDSAARRLEAPPLRRKIRRAPGLCVGKAAVAAAIAITEGLLTAPPGADALIDFTNDALSEEQFFAAAGLALQALPDSFDRWRDLSILSGLNCALPGLCLRLSMQRKSASLASKAA